MSDNTAEFPLQQMKQLGLTEEIYREERFSNEKSFGLYDFTEQHNQEIDNFILTS